MKEITGNMETIYNFKKRTSGPAWFAIKTTKENFEKILHLLSALGYRWFSGIDPQYRPDEYLCIYNRQIDLNATAAISWSQRSHSNLEEVPLSFFGIAIEADKDGNYW